MESALSIVHAKQALAQFGLLILAGSMTSLLSRAIKVPDVVIFLLVGMAMGPAGLGWLTLPADSELNQLVLIFGSSYILFDGGASLRFRVIKQVWITVVVISTVGLLITGAIVGWAAHHILGVPLIVALLLGATLASTDPATLVPIFKQVRIKDRVAQTIMSESAFNDAMGAITTFAVLAIAMGQTDFTVGRALFDLSWQTGVGILAGAVLGFLAATVIAHTRYGFLADYSRFVTLMAVIAAYVGADGLHASGFMAVFVFGIMLGNIEIFDYKLGRREKEEMEDFVSTTGLIMRMFIFILLGSQVDFALMSQNLVGGVLVATVLMLVARPVTVFVCAGADRRARWSFAELLFMCWTRETGVIPGALAGMLVGMKAPGAETIASVTFITIVMTILIQATTTKWLAGKLGLLAAERPPPPRSAP